MRRELSKRLRDKLWAFGEQLDEIRDSMRELKSERLQLRVTPTEKEEIDAFADLLGVSVADYMMHLHRRAMKELDLKIEREEHLRHRTGRERKFTADDANRTRKGGSRERERSTGRRRPKRPHQDRDQDDDEGSTSVGVRLFD